MTIYELEIGKDVKRIQVDNGAEVVLKKPFGWVELPRKIVSSVNATGAQKSNSREA